jgi:hypothetical protein
VVRIGKIVLEAPTTTAMAPRHASLLPFLSYQVDLNLTVPPLYIRLMRAVAINAFPCTNFSVVRVRINMLTTDSYIFCVSMTRIS